MSQENNSQAPVSQSPNDIKITDAISEVGDQLEAAQEANTESDSSDEGLEAVDEVIQEKKEQIKALKKKLKIKVDGEELEEEIDFDDEDTLKKHLQLSKVAQKRMNEYAQLEKELKEFVDALKKNPKAILSDPMLGIDLKELAQAVIEEEIENSKKSPEQLEKERLEAELREIKAEREREREEAKRKEFEILEQKEAERYDTLMTKALTNSSLPKSAYVIKKISDYMYMGLNEGIDILPEDVIPLVQEEIQQDIRDMLSIMPESAVEELIGVENLNRIRKKRVAAAKKANTPVSKAVQDTGKTSKESLQNAAKQMTFKDFFKI